MPPADASNALDVGVSTHTIRRVPRLERSGAPAFILEGRDRFVVGRNEQCDLVVPDASVSRAHARIEREGPVWTITDVGSSNGTTVQGEPVFGSHRLAHGDEIMLGRVRLRFVDDDQPRTETQKVHQPKPRLTPTELAVLVELCRPLYASGSAFKVPAEVSQIAATRVTGEGAVRMTLGTLYDKFGIVDGPSRRVRLAEEAVQRGVISARLYDADQQR